MFDQLSYLGYNALFCLPFLVLIWLRREFFEVLVAKWRPILLSTCMLTFYGSAIWPVALKCKCWAYGSEKISGFKVFGYVYLDDVIWWLLISLLFASYISLSTHYEKQGIDICWRELRGLLRSFACAFRGFRMITLERNSTVHVAIAVFVLLEAILFRISVVQWLFVVGSIALVLGFEIFNSCIERIASWPSGAREKTVRILDAEAMDQRDKEIGLIKDAAAFGVLVSAISAGVVGLMIFSERLIALLWGT